METVKEGIEEKDELESHQPVSLLLLDVNLPDSKGLKVAGKIKEFYK